MLLQFIFTSAAVTVNFLPKMENLLLTIERTFYIEEPWQNKRNSPCGVFVPLLCVEKGRLPLVLNN
jgi:hypothetical protein